MLIISLFISPLIFIIEREALWNQWSRILAPTCQTLNVENDSPSHNKHLLMLKGVLRPAFSTIEFLKKVSTCILPNLIFQPIFAISNPLELLLFSRATSNGKIFSFYLLCSVSSVPHVAILVVGRIMTT